MNTEDIWLLLYSQIVGIQHHPKNEERERMTPAQCVDAADAYAKAAEERLRGR